MKKSIVLALLVFVSLICFIGCSSSNSDSTSGTSPDPESPLNLISGQIIDSTIEGLGYQTPSHSGSTDSSGTFSYKEGESVTFSIGDLVLGQTIGKPIVTVLDLAPGAVNIDNRIALNLARLLQSLDGDCDPRNGIQLTVQIVNALSAGLIDFDQATEAFEADPAVTSLFEHLNTLQVFSEGQIGWLRSAEDARAHFIQAYKDTWKARRASMDTDGNGEADTFVEYFQDAAGRLIRAETTCCGADDPSEIEYREYDSNGYLSRVEYETGGHTTRIDAYENDAHGNKTKYFYDQDGDGIWNGIQAFEFDVKGNITKQSQDFNADGIYEAVYNFFFDESGKPTRREDDGNADGVPDSIWTYVYVDGNRVREDYDDNADGIVDRALHYSYDANGNRLTAANDQNNNGVFTDVNEWVQTWTYDTDNRMKSQLTVSTNDGASYAEYEYDANGNTVLEQSDSEYDGVTPAWDRQSTRLYDDESRLLRWASDDDFNGVIDQQFDFLYDDFGNVVESTMFDGRNTTRSTFIWEQSITPGYDTWFAPYDSELRG